MHFSFIQKTWKRQVSVLWGHHCPTHGDKRSLSATSSHPLSHKTARFGISLVPRARGYLSILLPEIKGCGIGVLAMEAAAAHAWRNSFCSQIQPPTALKTSNFKMTERAPKDIRAGGRKDKKRRSSSTLGCHHLSLTWGERTYFQLPFLTHKIQGEIPIWPTAQAHPICCRGRATLSRATLNRDQLLKYSPAE